MFRAHWPAPAIAFAALTACSQISQSSGAPEPTHGQAQFSSDDHRAAQALSLGNVRAVSDAADPFDQAVLCMVAIDEIYARLKGLEVSLPKSQVDALAKTRAIYEGRARAAFATEPASDTIQAARRRLAAAHPEPSERAQIAIACLRKLI